MGSQWRQHSPAFVCIGCSRAPPWYQGQKLLVGYCCFSSADTDTDTVAIVALLFYAWPLTTKGMFRRTLRTLNVTPVFQLIHKYCYYSIFTLEYVNKRLVPLINTAIQTHNKQLPTQQHST